MQRHCWASSDDTVRRWVEQGRLSDLRDEAGARVVDGTELAATLVDSGKELGRLDRGFRPPERPEPPHRDRHQRSSPTP